MLREAVVLVAVPTITTTTKEMVPLAIIPPFPSVIIPVVFFEVIDIDARTCTCTCTCTVPRSSTINPDDDSATINDGSEYTNSAVRMGGEGRQIATACLVLLIMMLILVAVGGVSGGGDAQ